MVAYERDVLIEALCTTVAMVAKNVLFLYFLFHLLLIATMFRATNLPFVVSFILFRTVVRERVSSHGPVNELLNVAGKQLMMNYKSYLLLVHNASLRTS